MAKKGIEKGFRAIIPEDHTEPIKTIITTKYPLTHIYYWEGRGHPTDQFGNTVIVWEKGITNKKKEEFVKKILADKV